MTTATRPSDAVPALVQACRYATRVLEALATIPQPSDPLEAEMLLKTKQQLRWAFTSLCKADKHMNELIERGEERIKAQS